MASSIVHLTDNLDLIPGTFDLMLLPKLTRSWTFENESRLLATLLAPLKSDYDLIIIDTVPTPSVYTNNAIVASDYVMIPLQAEEESTNNIQNVNQFLIVSTFTRVFWFKLVQIINLTKNLRGLKHQHLAGAFFLASIQDNSSALFEY